MTTAPRRPRFPAVLARGVDAAASPPPLVRPQRPVHDAARDAVRRPVPAGLGLDSERVRARMVARLRAEGVTNESVLQAFAAVPRHRFVDSALATQAYEDTSLPIGHGQTISKPSVVARMLELLFDGVRPRELGRLGRVLEIGTGCGYQTALLSTLGRHVVSVERLRPLFDKASVNLVDWRAGDRIRLVFGDGRLGHGPLAPFDAIIAAAGGEDLPQAWLDQMAVGGRLVAPTQDAGGRGQSLVVVDRTAEGWTRRRHESVWFVPLKSGTE